MRKIFLFVFFIFFLVGDFCYPKNIKLTLAFQQQTRYTNITFDPIKKEIYAIYHGIKKSYNYPPYFISTFDLQTLQLKESIELNISYPYDTLKYFPELADLNSLFFRRDSCLYLVYPVYHRFSESSPYHYLLKFNLVSKQLVYNKFLVAGEPKNVTLSPDKNYFYINIPADSTVFIYDLARDKVHYSASHDSVHWSYNSIFNWDSKYINLVQARKLTVWDFINDTIVKSIPVVRTSHWMIFQITPDYQKVLLAEQGGALWLYDYLSDTLIYTYGIVGATNYVLFSRDNPHRLYWFNDGRRLGYFDYVTRESKTWGGGEGYPNYKFSFNNIEYWYDSFFLISSPAAYIYFIENGKEYMFIAGDGIGIFELETMNPVRIIAPPVFHVAKSPNSGLRHQFLPKKDDIYIYQYLSDSAYIVQETESGYEVLSKWGTRSFIESTRYYIDKVRENNYVIFSTKTDSEIVSFTLPPEESILRFNSKNLICTYNSQRKSILVRDIIENRLISEAFIPWDTSYSTIFITISNNFRFAGITQSFNFVENLTTYEYYNSFLMDITSGEVVKKLFYTPKVPGRSLQKVLHCFSPNSQYFSYSIADSGVFVVDLLNFETWELTCAQRTFPFLLMFSNEKYLALILNSSSELSSIILFIDFKSNIIVDEIHLPKGFYFAGVPTRPTSTEDGKFLFIASPFCLGYIDAPEYFSQLTDIPQNIKPESFDIAFSSPNLIMNILESGLWKLEIFDVLGNRIYRSEEYLSAGWNTIESRSLDKLPCGTFFVRLSKGTKTFRSKFIKF